MKKWICFILLICLSLAASGCTEQADSPTEPVATTADQALILMEAGNYREALVLMEKNPEKYADVYDEVRFYAAKTALESENYQDAVPLLQDNTHPEAAALLEEARYLLAGQLMKAGEYEAAIVCLENNSFDGAARLLKEAKYRLACVAMEAEDYAKAIGLLEDNSYMYAGTLLKEARNLGAAIEIEQYYQEILTQIDADHPGTGYYNKLCDMLSEISATMERDGNVDNVSEQFAEIFGYKPKSIAGATEDMERLRAELVTKYFYDTPFIPYAVMDYLMEIWGRPCGYTHFEMTDTHGSMVIDQPYEYIKKASISPKTMAYLLASCCAEGAQVTRDGSTITITFDKYRPDGDYSRGYVHCAPDAQEQKVEGLFMGMTFEHYDAYLDDDGLHVTVTFTPATRYYMEYLSIELFLVNTNDDCVADSSHYFENISDSTITFTVLFQGVKSEDLPGSQYMLLYYLAAVMNN